MSLVISLTEEESILLIEKARSLKVDPVELALAAINDLVSSPRADFLVAAKHVLTKNREFYEKLSNRKTPSSSAQADKPPAQGRGR